MKGFAQRVTCEAVNAIPHPVHTAGTTNVIFGTRNISVALHSVWKKVQLTPLPLRKGIKWKVLAAETLKVVPSTPNLVTGSWFGAASSYAIGNHQRHLGRHLEL